MKRRLLNFLTLLSLLLFLVSLTAWVGSHGREAFFSYRGDHEYEAWAGGGQMRLDVTFRYVTPIADADRFRDSPALGPERPDPWEAMYRGRIFGISKSSRAIGLPAGHVFGFYYSSGQTIYGSSEPPLRVRGVHTEVYAPLWAFSLFLSLPAIGRVVRRIRARRRPAPGHCLACGYDLRATPGQCPECGAAAISPVAQ